MPVRRTILPLDRWSLVVVGASLLLMMGICGLDLLTPTPLILLYLIPVILTATMTRGWWWVVIVAASTAVWFGARWVAPPPEALINGEREPFLMAAWNTLSRLGILALVGFLCARLRHYSRSPWALRSSRDTTGMLSTSGLGEALSHRDLSDRLASGPVGLLLLDADRRVSAYAGQSGEYGALVAAVVSRVLLDHARPEDVCVRLSPNRFMVLMPGADAAAAATLNAAVQEALPEVTRSLDDSVAVFTLTVYSPAPVRNVEAMRLYAETRLTTLKVLGQGRSHSETWTPGTGPMFAGSGGPVTAG